MISMARGFGAPDSVPAGNVAANDVERVVARAHLAGDGRHDVHDVAVALDPHEVRHLDRAGTQTRPRSLRRQVDQHHVLGPLLGVGQQLRGQPGVLLGVAPRGRVPAGGCTHGRVRRSP